MASIDLKSPQGVEYLENYLSSKSYIVGFEPSKADLDTFALIQTPQAKTPNVLRWYNHIKSFSDKDKVQFPNKKADFSSTEGSSSKPADDDDDIDLFGSDDEEDEEAERIRQERLKAYSEKKATKKVVIAKSSIVLDVKPWDDETDMKKLEECVRTIQMDGLVWGASKLVEIAFGIKKLQIMCVVEDDKVSVDALVELIQEFEDFVQSVDIAAFNKI
ncbi:elongation factor 1-beta [Daktulosphaira vitifoliae]|uniref:elongation factor 1-beta n=1 Tax=Daktulosphaira vitifoliae TaxID=58002 RepID=UPI0021AAC3E5|nr:elongation factor 1-beta [Daktulosphaira vitifoliae]